MKRVIGKKICALTIACSLSGVLQAQLIDDFSTPGLAEYTLTRILDNGVAEANVSFSDSTGSLVASYGGTVSQPEQVVFLRGDYSLAVGQMLLVDVLFPTQTSQMDFGIAVSQLLSPTSVANPTPTDTRLTFNWAAVYVRPSQDAVRSATSIAGTLTSGVGVLGAAENTVGMLFIERNSLTQFTLGYYNTSAVRFVSNTGNFVATDVGTAIGFYGDLRAVGGTLGSLDNFRIEPIPEPSTLAMCGLGFAGLLVAIRRRK